MPTSTRTRASEPLVRGCTHPSAAPLAESAHARSQGFTLLELTIVLLIMAIAASFVIPRLRDVDSAALGSSAARLATTTRYLYEEAAFRRRPMRLNLDLDKQAYWVTVLDPDADGDEPQFVVEDSPLAHPVGLPRGVTFADVVLPALGTVHEGLVFAQFFPEGYADPLVVHLTNTRHQFTTLAIEPLTGRTRIADAYVELDAGRVADARRQEDAADGRRSMPARGGSRATTP